MDLGVRARHALWIARTMARTDLSPLSPADVQRIEAVSRPRAVPAGTLLMGAGEESGMVYIIRDGEVELYHKRLVGRRTVALVRPVGVIGDIPMFCGKPMPFDAVASRHCVVFALARDQLLDLLQASSSLALGWLTSVARRMEDNQRRILTVLTKDLRAQVATVLLDEREPGADGVWMVRLPQAVVAQLLGARRQSVSRVLGDLRASGLVTTGYREIRLHDLEALAEVAGEPAVPEPCGPGAPPTPARGGRPVSPSSTRGGSVQRS